MIKLMDEPISMEGQVLDRARFNDEAALHHRSIIAYARSLCGDAEVARDLAQDALLAAYHARESFDLNRSFPAWVRGILRHKWVDLARRNRVAFVDEETLGELDAQYNEWDALADRGTGVIGALQDCMQKLSARQTRVVELVYYEGRSSDDAATHLESSAAAVRKQLQRIREQLRECLQRTTSSFGGQDHV